MVKTLVFILAIVLIMYPYVNLVGLNENLFTWKISIMGLGIALLFFSGVLDGMDIH